MCALFMQSSVYIHIQCRMLDKDPHKRPSAISILQEPFLQERMQVSSVLLVGR